MSNQQPKERGDQYRQRAFLLPFLMVAVFLVLVARLLYLQVISDDFKRQAERNAFYHRPIYPDRGAIFDRNGELVVYNEAAYDLLVTKKELQPFDTTALCEILAIDRAYLEERLTSLGDRSKNPGYSPYTPQRLLSQLPLEKIAPLREQLFNYPGFSVNRRPIRRYNTQHAALLLGYLAECNPIELSEDPELAVGDYVGKTGVEKKYETVLRGKKGAEILIRDALGRIQGKYKQGVEDVAPVDGKNIYLSLDIKLQIFGEELMQGKQGAIVAIEPQSGEVLALVSSPSFDPALLAGKELGENYRKLQTAASKPLYDRAIMGTYPPGSTFKVTQAAIFLHHEVITPYTRYSCYGGYPLLRGRPRCHGHISPADVSYAIATSCNSFFCWGLHDMLDTRSRFPSIQQAFDAWKDDLVAMGFGYRLGIDLPGEKRGYIPNSKVYDKIYNKRWASSNIISVAIGQGEISATPLQTANLAAIVANRGHFYTPHIVASVEGGAIDSIFLAPRETGIEKEYWELIAEGMAQAVTSGTCRRANFAPGEIVVCGKTGTAENASGRDHSAFIGFAPKDNPQIAISVYVENGGFGAYYGVPIGALMMEYYLRNGELSPYSQEVAENMKNSRIPYYNAY